jgi:hypothetical protein
MIIETKDKKKEEKIQDMEVTDNKGINTLENKEGAEEAEEEVVAEEAVAEEIEEIMMIITLMEGLDKTEGLAKNINLLTLTQTTENIMKMMRNFLQR